MQPRIDQGYLTNKRQPKFKIITTFIFIGLDGEVIFRYGSLSPMAVGSFYFWMLGFAICSSGLGAKNKDQSIGMRRIVTQVANVDVGVRVFLPVVSARRGYRLWRLDAALGEKRPAEGGNLSFGDGVARFGWQ